MSAAWQTIFEIVCLLHKYGKNGYVVHIKTSVFTTETRKKRVCCVCVCVFFPFILDIKFVGRTSRGHTGFLIHLLSAVRALIFLARRIQPFLSLVDREVEFCVLTMNSFSTRWAFLFLFFIFSVRKIPFAGIELTSQRVRELRGTSELPGRSAVYIIISIVIVEKTGLLYILIVKLVFYWWK